MDPDIQECVFIFESPSAEDLISGRQEGKALSSALSLSGVPTQYFHIANLRILKMALMNVAKHPKKMTRLSGKGAILESKLFIPILHFSFHANDDGLGLASDEFCPWSEFNDILKQFNDTYGRLRPDKSSVLVSLSACCGFSVCNHLPADRPTPFAWLVGFPTPVAWSDALVAFVSYYHLITQKRMKAQEAPDPFQYCCGPRA